MGEDKRGGVERLLQDQRVEAYERLRHHHLLHLMARLPRLQPFERRHPGLEEEQSYLRLLLQRSEVLIQVHHQSSPS